MRTLVISWQRLVDSNGCTCDRCDATGMALEKAVDQLCRMLGELGVEVVLEKRALRESEFAEDPLASNRIWVAARPIEEWLGAEVGRSTCCTVCGNAECRTLTVEGKTYEAVPVELIVKAGLLAVAQGLFPGPAVPCCSTDRCEGETGDACCPGG